MSHEGSFEGFLRKYQDMVFGVALRLLANAADAEDVAQEVFMRAFERFETIGPSPTAAGWLKTVTTNMCLNHLSRYRRRWRLFSELTRDAGAPATRIETNIASVTISGSDIGEADEHVRLEQALQRLPDHQRVPIILFHLEGKNYQEIAGLLGVSLGKLKTDIHRGREALKRKLTITHETR